MPSGRCQVSQLKAIHQEFSDNGPELPHLLLVDVPQLFLLIFWTMTHARFCSHAHFWLLVLWATVSFFQEFALLSSMECVQLWVYWCFCFPETELLTWSVDVLPPWSNTFCELLKWMEVSFAWEATILSQFLTIGCTNLLCCSRLIFVLKYHPHGSKIHYPVAAISAIVLHLEDDMQYCVSYCFSSCT